MGGEYPSILDQYTTTHLTQPQSMAQIRELGEGIGSFLLFKQQIPFFGATIVLYASLQVCRNAQNSLPFPDIFPMIHWPNSQTPYNLSHKAKSKESNNSWPRFFLLEKKKTQTQTQNILIVHSLYRNTPLASWRSLRSNNFLDASLLPCINTSKEKYIQKAKRSLFISQVCF